LGQLLHALQAINRHTEEQMQYQGVWHAIRSMAAAEGLAGFYKGMRVKLLQTVLAAALLMVLKEKIFLATRAALAPEAAAAAARRVAGI
jgi:adenine nucleotide transporter 17